jgi:fluoride ion exporter CrcB/FEX
MNNSLLVSPGRPRLPSLNDDFPVGTFLINVSGSFAIGFHLFLGRLS